MGQMQTATALELIYENLGTIAGYVAVGLTAIAAAKVKEWYERRKSRRAILDAVSAGRITTNYLVEVRAATDCDRITVNQFHNGEHFASGASVQKLSLTHYVLRTGISMPVVPDSAAPNATPATFMTNTIERLFADGYVECHNFECPDPWVSRYQTLNGIRGVVLCLIPGRTPKEAYGLMAFCWLEDRQFTSDEIRQFMVYARRASAFL